MVQKLRTLWVKFMFAIEIEASFIIKPGLMWSAYACVIPTIYIQYELMDFLLRPKSNVTLQLQVWAHTRSSLNRNSYF